MPVRIYDISKKLGLENKEVLTKAKALGIAAKVPSSSLDKITAEYLEEQILKDHPELAAPKPVEPPPPPPRAPEPIAVISAPVIEAVKTVVEEIAAKAEPVVTAIAEKILPTETKPAETAIAE